MTEKLVCPACGSPQGQGCWDLEPEGSCPDPVPESARFAPAPRIDPENPNLRRAIVSSAEILTGVCHGLALQSGWWSKPDALAPYMTPVRLMLMVSELGEAMEGDRKNKRDDHLPHRSSLEVELADLVIRAFDMAGGQGLDLAGAIAEKLAYNARRADHRLEERAKEGGKRY